MIQTELLSQIMMLIAVLVIFVNIATEVIKSVYNFKSTQTLNVFVTVLSIVLTVLVLVAYFQIEGLALTWYLIIAFIITGFMVAYAAMFGYDKLLKYFEWVK